jgi:hypothetical protein
VSHEARSSFTLAIVAYVTDRSSATPLEAPTRADAEAAIARLRSMASDLRGCAILGPDGEAIAATGELERWGRAAAELLAAADAAADEPATKVHVATEEGEAFAVREHGIALVAVAERFTLASLVIFDMRAVLRDLVRAGSPQLAASGRRA